MSTDFHPAVKEWRNRRPVVFKGTATGIARASGSRNIKRTWNCRAFSGNWMAEPNHGGSSSEKRRETVKVIFMKMQKKFEDSFYGRPPEEGVPHLPVHALNLGNLDSAYVSDILAEEYEIYTRAGAHCAPLMHQALKTEEQKGCVRFSFSWFNTEGKLRQQ